MNKTYIADKLDKAGVTDLLTGEQIYLRPMAEEDTDMVVAWRNQDWVMKNFIYRAPFTREGHLQWIHTQIDTGRVVQFIICLKASDKPVGSVYFRDIDVTHHKAEYGIFLGEKEALGRGIGTEAAKLALQYAFSVLKLHRVMLRVLADNSRARKSYEKAGFKEEGRFREDVYLDGRYLDVIFMGILNPEKV